MPRLSPVPLVPLVSLALAAGACRDPVAPLPRTGPPRALDISASYFGTGSTRIRLEEDRLAYSYVPWGTADGRPTDAAVVTPDSAAWAAFWTALDHAGVRSWPRECINREVQDGGGISLDVTHAGGRIAVVTANAYPGRDGRCDRAQVTPELTELLDAVRALVGRPFPGRTPAAVALPSEGAPLALRVSVWQFPLGTREVTQHGDTLVVTGRPQSTYPSGSDATARVVPAASDWRAFWIAAERAGVRYWPRECRDPNVLDGGAFTLELTVPAGRITATGLNAFPRATGECVLLSGSVRPPGAIDDYLAFLAAVGRLVGRPYP